MDTFLISDREWSETIGGTTYRHRGVQRIETCQRVDGPALYFVSRVDNWIDGQRQSGSCTRGPGHDGKPFTCVVLPNE